MKYYINHILKGGIVVVFIFRFTLLDYMYCLDMVRLRVRLSFSDIFRLDGDLLIEFESVLIN